MPEEQKLIFFDKFAPFENEQLGCIQDYLTEIVSESFNDVARHEIEWAELDFQYINDYGVR